MKVILQGKQLRLTAGIKQYAEEHLVRHLTRFVGDQAAELRIELGRVNASKGGGQKECHLTLRLPGVKAIQVEETTQDTYASLDLAADRLVRVAKEQLARRRRGAGHRAQHPLASAVTDDVPRRRQNKRRT
jgi:ribosomal subunit interface protein